MTDSNPTQNDNSPDLRSAGITTESNRQSRNPIGPFVRRGSYWLKLVLQPIVAVTCVIAFAFAFGYTQRHFGWFNNARTSIVSERAEEDSLFACSMLCVFVKAPGRCPVCGMELQQIEVSGDGKDVFGVTIEPAARRLANIETVTALNMPVTDELEVLGRISYDETAEATISAYVDGRIEDLRVDYTGAQVEQGQVLAVLYSPDLYSDQVGLLTGKKAIRENRVSSGRVRQSNQRIYESARRRLIEFGIPAAEVDAIEKRNRPDSQIRIVAPVSGTVVAKLVEEGNYIKQGMPLLKIADLSKVWLKLKVFPEDTTRLKIGQSVTILMQSQPGREFVGQISFIQPAIDEQTQTVTVRVVVPNEAGLIKVGDFAKARIQKSISSEDQLVVVPRESVLINGSDSVAYVETEPGRFEFRKVEVAEIMGDKISITSGILPGEQVVASGVFMLDSTFNIQGKVSLIDPNRASRKLESQVAKKPAKATTSIEEAQEIEEALSGLGAEDRRLAESQLICPVTEVRLGSHGMGEPISVVVNGTPVMICCEGCRSHLLEEPEKYFAILQEYRRAKSDDSEQR
jgi:Cu(I)/Ag(I) efflux system membrane fusion protein